MCVCGIDFQLSADDDAWVKAGAQDFAQSVLQSIEDRMPENAIMTAGISHQDRRWSGTSGVGHIKKLAVK